MSEQTAFRALADPTRRAILMHLADKDMTIAQVSEHFDMTRAAVKKHLTVLEEGALISVAINGRERINHLEPMGMKSVLDWMSHFSTFWDNKLGKLKLAIEADKQKGNTK